MQRKVEMQKLIGMCEDWAVKLNLDKNVSPLNQNLKLIEEFGELAKNIQKRNVLEIMDGLGDTLVVCAVMASQVRKFIISAESASLNLFATNDANLNMPIHHIDDLPKLFWTATQALHRYTTFAVDSYQQKQSGHYLFQFAGKLVSEFDKLAKCLDLDIIKCLKMAYSTIHFRSGEIVDGIFVKREPQAVIQISTKLLDLSIDNLIERIVEYAYQNDIKFFKVEYTIDDLAEDILVKEIN